MMIPTQSILICGRMTVIAASAVLRKQTFYMLAASIETCCMRFLNLLLSFLVHQNVLTGRSSNGKVEVKGCVGSAFFNHHSHNIARKRSTHTHTYTHTNTRTYLGDTTSLQLLVIYARKCVLCARACVCVYA